MKNITIKDIARICKVGVSTVSRAINNDSGISEETRERILETAKKYHYVPNTSARNLGATETNTVAVLVYSVTNIFFSAMYGMFQTQLEDRGYDYLLHSVKDTQDIVAEGIRLVKEKRLKGIIFLGGWIDPDKMRLDDIPVPYVFCTVYQDIDLPKSDSPSVGIDDVKEGRRIVEYLIKKGHERIAIIAGVEGDRATGAGRLKGYKQALEAAGLPIDERLICHMKKNLEEFTAANGYAVCKELIEKGIDFTALFCVSDLTAIGAYRAIYDSDRRIPEDISVAGFDGIELGEYIEPPITTIRQPRDKMVVETVRILSEKIEGVDKNEQLVLKGKLLERASIADITK
ncbi:MAG: LacI family transcriptional regulator [Lachnospiraceae bacterium]|nr:LacI family transcriptional regulator [Lachnospiraceae bacterium]